MRDLVEAKFKEYKENIPQNHDFRFWFAKSNLWGWIYSCFIAQGQNISKPCVVDLLDGTLRDEAPLSCYSFVQAFKEISKDMQEEVSMQASPSSNLYKRWARMLGCEEYRRTNPVVYEFGLIPCHFNAINEELDDAFKRYKLSKQDSLEAAVILFLDLIKIYPFEDESVDMAFIMLMYCLYVLGYPIPELGLKEGEFNSLVTLYMSESESYEEFYNQFLKSLYNRLDSVVLFEKQALEQEV